MTTRSKEIKMTEIDMSVTQSDYEDPLDAFID